MDFFDFIKDNKIIALIISLVLNIILAVFLSFNLLNNEDKKEIDNNYFAIKEEVKDTNNFKVEIKGAVINPGVYSVSSEEIIDDLIKKAGGLKKNAYINNINLSKKLKDELVVYIYTKSEYDKLKKSNVYIKEIYIDKPCECSTYNISNCIDNAKSEIVSSDIDTVYSNDINSNSSLININTASKEDLLTLPGIGESKVSAIIEYRSKNGNFKSIDEITNVSGIGNALFEKIKDHITI